MSYWAVFVIGITASLSTCMAVVGGLVLSMSANDSKSGYRAKPQILFHIGRLASFFVFGGLIGALGTAFTLNIAATVIFNVVIGLILLFFGLKLIGLRFVKTFSLSMPGFLSKQAFKFFGLRYPFASFVAGVATFFLPCGFTQAMQIYALKSGGFLAGAFTMSAFAFGTLPILALASFSPSIIKGESQKKIFFRVAGALIIVFSLFNFYLPAVLLGWIPPLFSF